MGASTYVIAANALEQILKTTFPGVDVVHDHVHEAVGYKGPRIGIAPMREMPNSRARVALEAWIEIRYMDLWDRKIDPAQVVDPRIIATKADTLTNSIRNASVTKSGDMWFFSVEDITYPLDPTGNNSRFYMTLRAWGNNSSLVETTS